MCAIISVGHCGKDGKMESWFSKFSYSSVTIILVSAFP